MFFGRGGRQGSGEAPRAGERVEVLVSCGGSQGGAGGLLRRRRLEAEAGRVGRLLVCSEGGLGGGGAQGRSIDGDELGRGAHKVGRGAGRSPAASWGRGGVEQIGRAHV